jgi:hypothetical protein
MTPALPPGGLCPRWRALCRDLFVHETESELILNGSRDVSFTLDLVKKDIGLFHKNAKAVNVPLEISPLQVSILDRQLASDDVPRPSFEAANPISEHHAKGLQRPLILFSSLTAHADQGLTRRQQRGPPGFVGAFRSGPVGTPTQTDGTHDSNRSSHKTECGSGQEGHLNCDTHIES